MNNIENIVFLDDRNWEEFVNGDDVCVLFFMLGCDLGCRKQIPAIVDFSQRYGKRFLTGVVNVAKSPNAVAAFEVDRLPVTFVTRKGMVLGRLDSFFTASSETVEELVRYLTHFEKMDIDVVSQGSAHLNPHCSIG